MVIVSPLNWGYSPSKSPKWLTNGGYYLLTNWDDPPNTNSQHVPFLSWIYSPARGCQFFHKGLVQDSRCLNMFFGSSTCWWGVSILNLGWGWVVSKIEISDPFGSHPFSGCVLRCPRKLVNGWKYKPLVNVDYKWHRTDLHAKLLGCPRKLATP